MMSATLLLSGAALTQGCPGAMKAVDAKLVTQPALSAVSQAQMTTLRAEGVRLHKAGKQIASMKALADASKVLGL
jgi:hypothetical protein